MSDETRPAKPGYWAVIPARIRYDDQIPPNAKLLYAEISSMIGPDGYCWATDEYFAKVFQFAERTVRDLMAKLKAAGYIRIEEERGQHKVLRYRRIYAELNPLAGAAPQPGSILADFCQKDGADRFFSAEIFRKSAEILQKEPAYNIKEQYKGTETSADTSAGTGARTDKAPAAKILPERFQAFWDFYRAIPGRDGRRRNDHRQTALEAWDKLAPDDALVDRIGKALIRQLETDEWSRGIGIPMAATYLNQRRWEDAEDLPDLPKTSRPSERGKDVVRL